MENTPTDPAPGAARLRAPATPPRLGLRALLAVGAGGALGAAARYGAALAVPPDGAALPWATLAVNLVGAVLLGAVAAVPVGGLPGDALARPFLGPGFCGGLTTFSTLTVEVTSRWAERPELAAGYAVLSAGLTLPAAWFGTTLVVRARRAAAGRGRRPGGRGRRP